MLKLKRKVMRNGFRDFRGAGPLIYVNMIVVSLSDGECADAAWALRTSAVLINLVIYYRDTVFILCIGC
mgnify:FL=1